MVIVYCYNKMHRNTYCAKLIQPVEACWRKHVNEPGYHWSRLITHYEGHEALVRVINSLPRNYVRNGHLADVIYNKTLRERQHPSAPIGISERIALLWTNGLETVRVSHWPITWPIYLHCIVTQEQVHCASHIVSDSDLFYSKMINLPIPKICY